MAHQPIIYAATCTCHPEEGIRYVGQTVKGVVARKGVHFWNARTPTSKSYTGYLYNWIRKHGEENIRFEVLQTCDVSEIDDREAFWIAKLRAEGHKLTNVKPGGANERGFNRPRQSEAMKGERNPMYGVDRRDVMAHARSFNKPMTPENRKRMSERQSGENNYKAKLTEDIVRLIRGTPYYHGINAALGREYGVAPQVISAVRLRKSWKHVE